jgi:DinB superfamily
VHPQLQEIVDEFESARARLQRLAAGRSDEDWARRPTPDRWSVAECVAHLNLTSAAFVPPLRRILGASGLPRLTDPRRRFRRDPFGWLLWRTMGPPVRLRIKTPTRFVPGAAAPKDQLIAEFYQWQDQQIALVRDADGLELDRIRVPSPFRRRISYNGYSALSVLPRHQHRHLWQAEQTIRA